VSKFGHSPEENEMNQMSSAISWRSLILGAWVKSLRRFVGAEQASDVVLDLTEVNLVDVDVVQFLSLCVNRSGAQLWGGSDVAVKNS
jgi:hypothetical protein